MTDATLMAADQPNTDAASEAEAATPSAAAETPADGQTSTEGAPQQGAEGEKQAEGQSAEEGELQGAPEAYSDFTFPEGVEPNQEVLDAFKTLAKDYDLSQEKAQAMLDLGNQMVERTVQQIEQAQLEDFEARNREWVDAVKADKEIGGDKMNENLAIAKEALDRVGSPELKELLDTTGMGNNPDVIKMFVRIGKAVSEDAVVNGGQGGGDQKSAAEKLYPSMTK